MLLALLPLPNCRDTLTNIDRSHSVADCSSHHFLKSFNFRLGVLPRCPFRLKARSPFRKLPSYKDSLKEVIQPLLPELLPCYDFTPVIGTPIETCLLAVSSASSRNTNSHGVTGGVYKARERIHRGMLIRDY